MNYFKRQQMTIAHQLQTMHKYLISFLAVSTIIFAVSCSSTRQSAMELNVDPVLHQAVFSKPEEAAIAFAQAVKNVDQEQFNKLLGADFREILPLDDVTSEDMNNFNHAWEKYHTLLPRGDKKMLLAIGEGKWTLPIPIVSSTSGWYFDIEEGRERMRIRRIGRNELATMQAVLAYYDAQMEYAMQDRNGNGVLEYAQKFISIPGTHDGLFWETAQGESLSPLGSLLADRSHGGGYHGYFFRILKAQGDNARGGAYSYMMAKYMRAGFALIAWPEDYGDTGIMSFMVSHDGIVYEQNLGSESASIAEKMSTYDPGAGWVPATEVNAPQNTTEQ